VKNCTIMYNSCPHGSGGVNNEGTLEMTGCGIGSNNGGSCGGVENIGTLKLKECVISGNTSNCVGGGIYNHGRGSVTWKKCSIPGNGAEYAGGASVITSRHQKPARIAGSRIARVKATGRTRSYVLQSNATARSKRPNTSRRVSGDRRVRARTPLDLGDAGRREVENALADRRASVRVGEDGAVERP
jgi:hypothetical protein